MYDFEDENIKCHAIIHAAAAATAGIGAGLAQIPGSDIVPITGIQIGMIISIAKVFDEDLGEGAAKGLLGGFSAGLVGREVVRGILGMIPGLGNAFKAGTAATMTETVGWLAVEHFKSKIRKEGRILEHGMRIGEAKAKEKFKNILERLEHNTIFVAVLIKMVYYVENNGLNEEVEEKINLILSICQKEIKDSILNEENFITEDIEEIDEMLIILDVEEKWELSQLLKEEFFNLIKKDSYNKEIRINECIERLE